MLTLAVSDLLLIPFTEFLFISVITYFISSCSVWFLLKFDWLFHIVFVPCEDFQAFTYLNTPNIIIHNLSLIITVSEVFLDLFLTSLFLLLFVHDILFPDILIFACELLISLGNLLFSVFFELWGEKLLLEGIGICFCQIPIFNVTGVL